MDLKSFLDIWEDGQIESHKELTRRIHEAGGKMWEAKLPEVAEILQQGTKAARAKAQETMKDVRHAMRIDYFNEEGLF